MSVEYIIDSAEAHGRDSGLDHEVGDLQDTLRIAWLLMTPAQRAELLDCFWADIDDSGHLDRLCEMVEAQRADVRRSAR